MGLSRFLAAPLAGVVLIAPIQTYATEDIDFVTEHLPEAAMDNRYAALPVWASDDEGWTADLQAAYARTSVDHLSIDGPMLSFAMTRSFSARWSFGAFAFFDALSLSGNNDRRPLNPFFIDAVPLDVPADALFTGLDGSARDVGAGAFVRRRYSSDRGGDWNWLGGVMWQRIELSDYRLNYTLLSGADEGATGTVDYSADYAHVSAFGGLQYVHRIRQWSFSPHLLAAMPLPRRGVKGCITGAGFDICGDQEKAGHGKHFGDPYVAVGMGVTYAPWGLTLDVGSTIAQALIEPIGHKGVDRNWLVSLDWRF